MAVVAAAAGARAAAAARVGGAQSSEWPLQPLQPLQSLQSLQPLARAPAFVPRTLGVLDASEWDEGEWDEAMEWLDQEDPDALVNDNEKRGLFLDSPKRGSAGAAESSQGIGDPFPWLAQAAESYEERMREQASEAAPPNWESQKPAWSEADSRWDCVADRVGTPPPIATAGPPGRTDSSALGRVELGLPADYDEEPTSEELELIEAAFKDMPPELLDDPDFMEDLDFIRAAGLQGLPLDDAEFLDNLYGMPSAGQEPSESVDRERPSADSEPGDDFTFADEAKLDSADPESVDQDLDPEPSEDVELTAPTDLDSAAPESVDQDIDPEPVEDVEVSASADLDSAASESVDQDIDSEPVEDVEVSASADLDSAAPESVNQDIDPEPVEDVEVSASADLDSVAPESVDLDIDSEPVEDVELTASADLDSVASESVDQDVELTASADLDSAASESVGQQWSSYDSVPVEEPFLDGGGVKPESEWKEVEVKVALTPEQERDKELLQQMKEAMASVLDRRSKVASKQEFLQRQEERLEQRKREILLMLEQNQGNLDVAQTKISTLKSVEKELQKNLDSLRRLIATQKEIEQKAAAERLKAQQELAERQKATQEEVAEEKYVPGWEGTVRNDNEEDLVLRVKGS